MYKLNEFQYIFCNMTSLKTHVFSLPSYLQLTFFSPVRCECPSGYEGIRCETNVDDCIGHTCMNNATCLDLIGSYECSCARGFTGGRCETKIAFCSGKNGDADGPCQNGGMCMDHFTHYTCKCKAGFAGENCTININDCVDHMCQVK